MSIPRALTIAGSDSGGGAGIQADLKTFAALKVHGTTAITAVTSQNTRSVTKIFEVPPEIVRAQIEAVVKDIRVQAIKTGMLYTPEIISLVAEHIKKSRTPLVVDPVMFSKTGSTLLKGTAIRVLIDELIPLSTVVTPNRPEAERITGMTIKNVKDAAKAAKSISKLGAKAVLLKGGHLDTVEQSVDVLHFKGHINHMANPRLARTTTHGTGCVLSAAITAEIAKRNTIPCAVQIANNFVHKAILRGFAVGKGYGPVNPMATLQEQDEKKQVIEQIEEGIKLLENSSFVAHLIPEVQSNLVMALPGAISADEMAAIPGRLVRIGKAKVKASASPEFGASRHLANYVLAALEVDNEIRAAFNIRYSEDILAVCEKLGLIISSYDRRKEPRAVETREGASTFWGARAAIKKIGSVPDIIFHRGAWGKEPIIIVLGKDPLKVTNIVQSIGRLSMRKENLSKL
ncbi:MAG: bifunctional hydroxymethylpyrimidine kinase/phosphomethylpyrimidine kinase [Candidatus Bathyarchaeia archaeon]